MGYTCHHTQLELLHDSHHGIVEIYSQRCVFSPKLQSYVHNCGNCQATTEVPQLTSMGMARKALLIGSVASKMRIQMIVQIYKICKHYSIILYIYI